MNCLHPQCKGRMAVRNTTVVDSTTIRRQRVCQVCSRKLVTIEQPYVGPRLRKANASLSGEAQDHLPTSAAAEGPIRSKR